MRLIQQRTYTQNPNPVQSLNQIKTRLRTFANERDWDQFHSPKNLAMALIVEAAELVEHFDVHGRTNAAGAGRAGAAQWLTEEQSQTLPPDKLAEVEQEIADIQIYLIRMADKLGVDMEQAVNAKIELNEKKYPAEKVRGNAEKYSGCEDGC